MTGGESITAKQARLAAQIARQRSELGYVYTNLKKPIFYTEQAMRGFGFLRQNPWVLSVIPAASSLVSLAIGVIRNKPPKSSLLARRLLRRDADREVEKESQSLGGHLLTWGGRGWKLFRLYGRMRKYFL